MSKVLITRSKLDGLATTIAAKSGATLPLTIAQMDAAVDGIVVGGGVDTSQDTVDAAHLLDGYTAHDSTGTAITGSYTPPTFATQAKSATPTESAQTVTPDNGYDGLSSVSVGAISSTYVGSGIDQRDSTDLTASGATVTAPAGYYASSASKSVASGSATVNSTITTTPTVSVDSSGLVTARLSGSVGATPRVTAGYISSGTTGTINYSGSKTLQLDTQAAATITPSTSSQTAVAAGKYTTGAVTVAAMPSGTAGTPTATKGSVSNHSVSVTPSVTNQTGYITGGTKTGTAVSVSASELVSGTYAVDSSGTKDVTNYASASVPSGSATASATKGTVSNHSVTVTPSVTRTAGYVTAGTANGTAVTVSASELVSGNKAITDNGTGIDVTNYSTVSVDVSGSGYTLTTIVPQQTVTPDSSRQATPQDWTTALVEGDHYLVTLDGTEYVCTCAKLWGTDLVIGDGNVFFGTSDTDYPFAFDWVSSSNHVAVCLNTSQHTIKVEHLELDTPAATLTTKTITANGTYNASSDSADGYSSVTVNVSGSSKNVQVAQSTSRATSSTYTSVCSLTCSTAGTYDVYWDCFRSSTGGTNGSQLYVGGSAYGSANTTFTNHIQTNHLTGVSLSKNQTVAVYARSRGNNYYAYCGQLTIVQSS